MLDRHGKEIIIAYERFIPTNLDETTITALLCIIFGVVCIWVLEKMAEKQS